jgi:dTDP-L-rhamnose 4-epimerase
LPTHVSDIAQANLLALSSEKADGMVLNVGTGRRTDLLTLYELLADFLGKKSIQAELRQQFREGDIRHCYADISAITKTLGFRPKITLEQGVADLVSWAKNERPEDKISAALSELSAHKLVI